MKRVTKLGFFMDGYLIQQLETFIYNMRNDWDTVILISGNGMVRVGKSVIAQQIASYLGERLNTPFGINNIVFTGEELRDQAVKSPPNSVFVYDEARGELDTKKVMEKMTKKLIDFFNECGYLNHAVIVVLPDFFDLPKFIACSRSTCLVNVYARRERVSLRTPIHEVTEVTRYDRGFFQFFDRPSKKKLYILGKKNYNDYDVVKPTFNGSFPNGFIINEEEYKAKKAKHVSRDKKDAYSELNLKRFVASVAIIAELTSQEQAAALLTRKGLPMTQARVNQLIKTGVFT